MRQGLNSFRKALESGFRIAAELHVILSPADAETAKGVVRGAHMICPYFCFNLDEIGDISLELQAQTVQRQTNGKE